VKGYLCKITVKYAKPKTWREIILPERMTFKNLHDIIQVIMGLNNYHAYFFKINNQYILDYSLNDISMWNDSAQETKDSTKLIIDDYLTENKSIFYRYDFGDEWECDIELKDIVEYYKSYPTITKYKGDYNLMEDCGAAGGWSYAMELITDPENMEIRIPEYDIYADYLTKFDKEYAQSTLIKIYGNGKYMKGYAIKLRFDKFRPLTWRDLIVPSGITFDELDIIIQILMGFDGDHLSEFRLENKYPLEMGDIIDEHFKMNKKIFYEYDFGDSWTFTIEIKKETDYDKPYPTIKRYNGDYNIIEDCGGVCRLMDVIYYYENPQEEVDELYSELIGELTKFNKDDVQEKLKELFLP